MDDGNFTPYLNWALKRGSVEAISNVSRIISKNCTKLSLNKSDVTGPRPGTMANF